ncbi:MAG: O-antigen ligase family protein [Pirellulales bacterium]
MSCVFAVGYFHGIVRANFVSTYTTFLFDFAVLGMYLSLLLRPPPATQGSGKSKIVPWITALILWPLIVSAVPQNDILVQFVAFRATAWFLPMLWVGSRVTLADLRVVALTLALLNLVALAFGVAEYHYGVQAFYPLNAVTQIIYNSSDVAGGHLRIPSTFLNSHSYGGTMVCTLPFILGLLLKKRVSDLEKALLFAGLVAAAGGILLCASRQPVVVAALLLFIAWAITGFSPRIAVGLAVALVVLGVTTSGNERLLRFTNLTETSHVAMRIRGSVNESFLEYLASYPFGAGMGSSVGTSIPYFLASKAPKLVGLENEYCRILIDQGWIGLLLWLAFIFWLHRRPPTRRDEAFVVLAYGLTLTTWATAFIGTGLLASIPGSAMLLMLMGIVAARRDEAPYTPPQSVQPLSSKSPRTSHSPDRQIARSLNTR